MRGGKRGGRAAGCAALGGVRGAGRAGVRGAGRAGMRGAGRAGVRGAGRAGMRGGGGGRLAGPVGTTRRRVGSVTIDWAVCAVSRGCARTHVMILITLAREVSEAYGIVKA
jgi:hypothetical protein